VYRLTPAQLRVNAEATAASGAVGAISRSDWVPVAVSRNRSWSRGGPGPRCLACPGANVRCRAMFCSAGERGWALPAARRMGACERTAVACRVSILLRVSREHDHRQLCARFSPPQPTVRRSTPSSRRAAHRTCHTASLLATLTIEPLTGQASLRCTTPSASRCTVSRGARGAFQAGACRPSPRDARCTLPLRSLGSAALAVWDCEREHTSASLDSTLYNTSPWRARAQARRERCADADPCGLRARVG
jgi:hypothetical protein